MKLTFGVSIRGLKKCLPKYLFVCLIFLPFMNTLTKYSMYEARKDYLIHVINIVLLNLLA